MPILEINGDDVLLGRGALTVNNEGNKRFRLIVEPWKVEYQAGANRKRKNEIAISVVNEVLQRGGRFLERVNESEMQALGLPEHCRAWKVAEMNVALEKAKQALRSKDPPPERDTHPPADAGVVSAGVQRPAPRELSVLPLAGLKNDDEDDDDDDCDDDDHDIASPKQPLEHHQSSGSSSPFLDLSRQQQREQASMVQRWQISNEPASIPPPRRQQPQPQQPHNPGDGSLHVNEQEQIDRLLRHDATAAPAGATMKAAATTTTTSCSTFAAASLQQQQQLPSSHHQHHADSVLLHELAWLEQRHRAMVGGVHHASTSTTVSSHQHFLLEQPQHDDDDIEETDV